MTGLDNPSRTLRNIENADVRNYPTIEVRTHFREFARLELAPMWLRISDYYNWKVHFKFKLYSEAVSNNDLNYDGDKDDSVWLNDGSVIETNHNGW